MEIDGENRAGDHETWLVESAVGMEEDGREKVMVVFTPLDREEAVSAEYDAQELGAMERAALKSAPLRAWNEFVGSGDVETVLFILKRLRGQLGRDDTVSINKQLSGFGLGSTMEVYRGSLEGTIAFVETTRPDCKMMVEAGGELATCMRNKHAPELQETDPTSGFTTRF